MTRKKEPPRLGRGLAALLGAVPPDPSRREHGDAPSVAMPSHLPIEALEAGPFQPRQNMAPDALEELADSIRSRGVLQPILVRPHPDREGAYQIIAGERRWRAAQLAGLHDVPVHLRALDDAAAMAAALVENLQRQDLNAIEEAEGLQRLLREFGLTQEEMAGALGKSRSHITNTMRLLHLPPNVRHEVQRGALSAGHARALLAHPDPSKAVYAVLAKRLTVRETEALAQEVSRPDERIAARTAIRKDPDISSLEQELSRKLGLRIDISFTGKAGTLKIHYASLEQLDGIITLLNG